MSEGGFIKGIIVPGLPQPLLAPEQNEGWGRIKDAFEKARQEIEEADPDVILVYSTMWPSVIGHQIQADPAPKWVHVDELFHDLGSIPYEFKIDSEFDTSFSIILFFILVLDIFNIATVHSLILHLHPPVNQVPKMRRSVKCQRTFVVV